MHIEVFGLLKSLILLNSKQTNSISYPYHPSLLSKTCLIMDRMSENKLSCKTGSR